MCHPFGMLKLSWCYKQEGTNLDLNVLCHKVRKCVAVSNGLGGFHSWEKGQRRPFISRGENLNAPVYCHNTICTKWPVAGSCLTRLRSWPNHQNRAGNRPGHPLDWTCIEVGPTNFQHPYKYQSAFPLEHHLSTSLENGRPSCVSFGK